MEQQYKWIQSIQKRGSRQAADQLIRAYYDEIFRFSLRQCGDREQALDLTQSIFLAMLRALPTYRREKAGFRTWLYRIAVHKIIDARRRARPPSVPLESTEPVSEEDFALRVQDRALLEQIEAFVCRLEPRIQAIYRLRLYAQHTFPEISAALGMPEAAVKSQYYRLMRRVREEFANDERES